MQIAPPFGYKEVVPFLKTQKVRPLAPLAADVGLADAVPAYVDAAEGAAIPVLPAALDHHLAALDAPLQPLPRFGTAGLADRGRRDPLHAHPLPAALQRVAIECAATLSRRGSQSAED
jgi:hypothetical protein